MTRDVLIGLGLGSAFTYLVDPQGGRRRRGMLADRMMRAGRRARGAVDAQVRDVANRTSGMAAATKARVSREPVAVDDRRLVERVRSRLGRVCSNARAIAIDAVEGAVTLRGPMLAREIERVLAAVRAVPGVKAAIDALQPYDSGDGVQDLRGGRERWPSMTGSRRWRPGRKTALVALGVGATAAYLAYSRPSAAVPEEPTFDGLGI